MPSGPVERYDFFLSRRGSVAPIAREVTDVLTEKRYRAFVQDYDIPITANFIEEMREAVKNSRDLVVLFTRDYEQSPYTRMEFTSFEIEGRKDDSTRSRAVLCCFTRSGDPDESRRTAWGPLSWPRAPPVCCACSASLSHRNSRLRQ